ncbi:MAG TPA: hypothetical protein VID26_07075 [Candidatus Limnocylindrales bacterium]|jgi:hypothetical protein
MDQTLDVDRYLTQRVGVVRRLLDADVPPAAAERWVSAWEEEARRRRIDPRDSEWWRSAWAWIALDCGGSEGTEGPAHALRVSPSREAIVRTLRIRVVAAIHASREVFAASRRWRDARVGSSASAPETPDREWLRREMEQLCGAYEAALGQGNRKSRRTRARARPTLV